MTIGLNTDAVKLLANIGFLGLSRNQPAASEAIFSVLCQLRPREEVGAVGSAMVALAANKPEIAIERLRRAEQTPSVVAFLAVAYGSLGEHAQAAELAEELEAMSAEKELVEIARSASQKGGIG